MPKFKFEVGIDSREYWFVTVEADTREQAAEKVPGAWDREEGKWEFSSNGGSSHNTWETGNGDLIDDGVLLDENGAAVTCECGSDNVSQFVPDDRDDLGYQCGACQAVWYSEILRA